MRFWGEMTQLRQPSGCWALCSLLWRNWLVHSLSDLRALQGHIIKAGPCSIAKADRAGGLGWVAWAAVSAELQLPSQSLTGSRWPNNMPAPPPPEIDACCCASFPASEKEESTYLGALRAMWQELRGSATVTVCLWQLVHGGLLGWAFHFRQWRERWRFQTDSSPLHPNGDIR